MMTAASRGRGGRRHRCRRSGSGGGDGIDRVASLEAPDTNGDGRINGADAFSTITTINGKSGLLLLTDWAFGWFSEDPTFLAGVTQLTQADITA